jgi:hypothetical protein
VTSRTKLVLTLLLIVSLGSLALYLNKDWFEKKPIQISYRVSPWMKDVRKGRSRGPDLGSPVVFSLNAYYKLTGVKVVVAAEVETNKYAHALWELTTQSNSTPIASFSYGERLRGMTTKIKNAQPEPLEPDVTYRLLITTPDKEAHHDFTTTPPKPPTEQPDAEK